MNPGTSLSWPSVSVIVPHYNDHARLRLCLRALTAQCYPLSPEIIVVDNGSDEPLDELRADFPGVTFLEEARIGSYCARNAGIAWAAGEILAFTDSDCTPRRDWLRHAVVRLRREADVGVVGGRVEIFAAFADSPNLYEIYDMAINLDQKAFVEKSGFAATANLVTRRPVIRDIGPFDGNLRSSGDLEWGNRVRRSRWKTVYEEKAVVRHPARDSAAMIEAKIRRITAGQRDLKPGLIDGIVYVAKHLAPPIGEMVRLRRSGLETNLRQTLSFFLLAWRLRWVRAVERVRRQWWTTEPPRS